MKASELMIGNWVYVPHNGNATHYGRITAILPSGAVEVDLNGDTVLCSSGSVAPIPLTPEILEKNGFKFDGSGQRSMMLISKPHFSEGIRYNIYVGLKKKTIEVFVAHPVEKSPNWRKSNKVYLEVCGCYVHELQQALRLCGNEKEITI